MGLASDVPAKPDSGTGLLPEVFLSGPDAAAGERDPRRPRDQFRRSAWSWLVSITVAAVLLYAALRDIDWRRVRDLIVGARWSFLAASGLTSCASYFLRSVRWRILLNAEGHFTVGTVFSANMAGYVGNNFLPARAGELIRTFLISSQSSLSKTYVLTTALAERMMDAVALVLWGSVVLLGVNPKPGWLESVSWSTTLIASAGVLAVFILPRTAGLCENLIRRVPMPHSIRERLLHLAGQILAGLRVFHDPGRLARFALLTAAVWGIDAAGVMIGGSAFRLNITYPMAALLLCGLGLGSAVAPTPGYVGTFQSVAVAVLTPFGLSREAAIAFILVVQALGYLVVLLLGLPPILRYRGLRGRTRIPTPL